jgi:hypothetical protein
MIDIEMFLNIIFASIYRLCLTVEGSRLQRSYQLSSFYGSLVELELMVHHNFAFATGWRGGKESTLLSLLQRGFKYRLSCSEL